MFHVKHQVMLPAEAHDWVPEGRHQLLEAYADTLLTWNKRVNLVARGTGKEQADEHIAHCLALASRVFPDGKTVVDWGTGGGLPAVPLAIAFPAVSFLAVDSTAKKTAAVKAMVREIGLDNVDVWNGRAEDWGGEASFFVSRATAPLRKLWQWSRRAMHDDDFATADGPANAARGGVGQSAFAQHGEPPAARQPWQPGLICLKGGDLGREIRQVKAEVEAMPLDAVLRGDRYREKYILYVRAPLAPQSRTTP